VRAPATHPDYWDPHVVFRATGNANDLVLGVVQLAEASDLFRHMPAGYPSLLRALFLYRNRMFHHGFEWPMDKRAKFETAAREAGWLETWFGQATSNHEPWIFYMTDEMIDACLDFIDQVLEATGALVVDLVTCHHGDRPYVRPGPIPA
jgi:hypothetical protein